MKKRIFAAVAAMSLLCGLLGGCIPAGRGQDTYAPTQTTQTQPTETTAPPFTLDSIRTETFTDITGDGANYDTACYMIYYGIMDAHEGAFDPDVMITRAQAADAFCRLTGESLQTELAEPEEPLTRKDLAVMLYETAKHLGCPTELSGDTAQTAYAQELEQADDSWKTAALWALESGVLRSFVGTQFLPDMIVSRMQVAQAIIGLKTMDPEDALASEIFMNMDKRTTESAAKQNHDAIQAVVDAAAQKYGAAGVQVAVIENGTVTDTYAYGWATKDTDPMTTDHKMRVASISKVIVGIAAQLLREEGVIDLDQDISQYWGVEIKSPKYPDIPITIRGMLTHCSAIINAGDDTSRAYNNVKAKLQSNNGFSGGVPGDIGYWSYNNYAFAVLGMTLELAAQQTLDGILADKLYNIMDVDAAFGSGDLKNTDLLATLYRVDGTVGRTAEQQKGFHSDPTPGANGTYFAGGLTVSVKDLAKLIALLAADGKYEGVQLLQPESLAQMETYVEPAVPGGSYQAHPMRYWPDLYGREGIFFHTGSAYGVFNAATYDPVTGDGVVVLTTGASGAKDDYGIYKICAEINAEIYKVIQ